VAFAALGIVNSSVFACRQTYYLRTYFFFNLGNSKSNAQIKYDISLVRCSSAVVLNLRAANFRYLKELFQDSTIPRSLTSCLNHKTNVFHDIKYELLSNSLRALCRCVILTEPKCASSSILEVRDYFFTLRMNIHIHEC